MTLHSRVTEQGTAMPEATLCGDHLALYSADFDVAANAAADRSSHEMWVETTGNDQIKCQICGSNGEPAVEPDIDDDAYAEFGKRVAAMLGSAEEWWPEGRLLDRIASFADEHLTVAIDDYRLNDSWRVLAESLDLEP